MRFHHVGLRVANLERATAWYERALGLRLEFSFEPPDGGVRVSMLSGDDGVRLELFQLAEPLELPAWSDPLAALAQGYGHVALSVDDLDRAFDELTAAGARAVWAPRPAPVPGSHFAYVADPDGNLIELIGDATKGRE